MSTKIAVFVFCLHDTEIDTNSSVLRCKKFKKNVGFFSSRGEEGFGMVWTHELVSRDSNVFKKIPICYVCNILCIATAMSSVYGGTYRKLGVY